MTRLYRSLALAAGVAGVLTGCTILAEPVPALRTANSDLTEIAAAIALLAETDNIQLADDAFVSSPVLTLQTRARGGNARLATSRLEAPLRFQLNTDGKRCWLTQVDKEAQVTLSTTDCLAAP